MREILFRGKTESGEFAVGYYLETLRYNNLHWIWNGKEYVKVDPATVGQFTGLTDKNGKRIWEGDIVEGNCHSQWSHRLQRCVVAYGRDGFEARHYIDGIGRNYYTYRVLFSKDVVVLGNIYDNPELLGVEG